MLSYEVLTLIINLSCEVLHTTRYKLTPEIVYEVSMSLQHVLIVSSEWYMFKMCACE